MFTIEFGGWPASIHNDFEQIKRMEAGKKLAKKIVAIDTGEHPSIEIQGSAKEPYRATLTECSCPDFLFHAQKTGSFAPCKHIYCLANELGLLSGAPEYDKESSDFNVEDEKERYYDLYESGQISSDVFIGVYGALLKLK